MVRVSRNIVSVGNNTKSEIPLPICRKGGEILVQLIFSITELSAAQVHRITFVNFCLTSPTAGRQDGTIYTILVKF